MTEEELQERRERHDANMRQIDASIEHMRVQNEKLARETQWYPLVVGSGATLAIVALTKLFL